eukprot:FR739934.1.p1 GENE.FR739934.1~~FR739934.1.p1  ORF type:complete len:204 (+),score=6.89 FR739934.1:45-656(+)
MDDSNYPDVTPHGEVVDGHYYRKDDDDMTLVKKETCLHATSIATCGAAPCYKNHAAEEHGMVETYTCICPIFPYYANDQVFEFSPDDVGHGGGMRCEAYNADSGTCSINGDSTPTGDIASNISGTALTEWANARVLDFSAASRKVENASFFTVSHALESRLTFPQYIICFVTTFCNNHGAYMNLLTLKGGYGRLPGHDIPNKI